MEQQLKELISGQKLVTLSPDETVESAFYKLSSNGITSAPVLLNNKSIEGLVDMLDLMTFLVKVCTKTLTDTFVGESRKLTTDDMAMIRKRSTDLRLAAVKELVDYSQRNPLIRLYEDQTVREALDLFAMKGIHRVLIVKRDETIAGILSQVTLLSALMKDSSLSQFKSNVGDLKNKTENLITVPQHELAIDSFMKMHENNLSSLGVVNHLGHLIGNLSAADLNEALDNFTKLLRSTIDYLSPLRKAQGRNVDFVLSVSPNISLFEAFQMMHKERVHRIYLTNEEKKPQVVISFTDILREIYDQGFKSGETITK
jgi:CBS domain-containing protein